MTIEEVRERHAFARKCKQLAEEAASLAQGGWDIPKDYMRDELLRWSKTYEYPLCVNTTQSDSASTEIK